MKFKVNGRDAGSDPAKALSQLLSLSFKDVIRQVERRQGAAVRRRLEDRVNQVITRELREMQRMLVGPYGLIGRDIGQAPLRLDPGSGPQVWSKKVKQESYSFTKWVPYSPAYTEFKRKKFPSKWRKWFTATGALRRELEGPALFGVGGLRDTIEVRITAARKLTDQKIAKLGNDLTSSQRGSSSDVTEGGARGRTGRLRLFNVNLKIFTNMTAKELPYLGTGTIGGLDSGAVLQKLNLSDEARRKLGPPAKFAGATTEIMQDRYRPTFSPLLEFWMARRIPNAVAKALYDQSGRR